MRTTFVLLRRNINNSIGRAGTAGTRGNNGGDGGTRYVLRGSNYNNRSFWRYRRFTVIIEVQADITAMVLLDTTVLVVQDKVIPVEGVVVSSRI